jgi:hypothetical protein
MRTVLTALCLSVGCGAYTPPGAGLSSASAVSLAAGVRRGGSPDCRGATAIAEKPAPLAESTTFTTVAELNKLCLQKCRCHTISTDPKPSVDPFAMARDDVSMLNGDVRKAVTGKGEVLTAAAQHFFGAGNTREGKRVRPVIVNLMGQATSAAGEIDEEQQSEAFSKHRGLAAITEMIHTASLVHDDVRPATPRPPRQTSPRSLAACPRTALPALGSLCPRQALSPSCHPSSPSRAPCPHPLPVPCMSGPR